MLYKLSSSVSTVFLNKNYDLETAVQRTSLFLDTRNKLTIAYLQGTIKKFKAEN